MSNKGFSSKVVSYTMNNGLAIYSIGEGCPVLLMPYPHGFPTSATAESALAQVLLELGYRVVTFDPPGAFRSTRPARIGMSKCLTAPRKHYMP
jgi:pimeloyl-ACP methyl ester carboxylesterase